MYCFFVVVVSDRSQTYSANEINMILAIDSETKKPIEWVDIDPEAFTGNTYNIPTYKATALWRMTTVLGFTPASPQPIICLCRKR